MKSTIKRLIATPFVVLILFSLLLVGCQSNKRGGGGLFTSIFGSKDVDSASTDEATDTTLNKIIEEESKAFEETEKEKVDKQLSKLPEKEFVIEGTVVGGAGYAILLDKLQVGKIEPLLSQEINPQGQFRFAGKIRQPELYQLRLPDGAIHIPTKPGDKMVFNINIENPTNFEVEGSLEPAYLREAYLQMEKINDMKDDLEHIMEDNKNGRNAEIMLDTMNKAMDRINKIRSENLRAIATRIDTAFTALLIAGRLDPELDYEFIQKTVKKFSKKYPYSPFYKGLHEKISAYVPTSPGQMAPEMLGDDLMGNPIRLSSTKGKYALINIWQEGCTECMNNIPYLKNYMARYSKKGFDIFSMNIDFEKDDWKIAVKKYDVPGRQAFDKDGFNSNTVQTWLIPSVPYYILIDKSGKIISRGNDLKVMEKVMIRIIK